MIEKAIQNLGETNRLRLRAPCEDDIQTLVALWTDPETTRYIGGPRDPAVVEEHFRAYAADPEKMVEIEHDYWWTVVEKASEDIVGLCSLLEKDVEGQIETEISYFVARDHWGQGYATEAARHVVAHAFSDLGLDSLVAVVDPENIPSIKVAKKLGMQFECESLRSDGATRLIYRRSKKGEKQI